MQFLKGITNFSRKDRVAILTLSILIFLVLLASIIVRNLEPKSELNQEKAEELIAIWNNFDEKSTVPQSLFQFDPNIISSQTLDSLLIPEFVKRNILSYRKAGGSFKSKTDLRKIYGMNDSIYSEIEDYISITFSNSVPTNKSQEKSENPEIKHTGYFDPNTVGFDSLLGYGFNNYQADNLVKYRNSGGIFYEPDDILKIYGVDSLFYSSIKHNIRIQKKAANKIENNTEIKFQLLELNSADSAQLVKLNGIGPVFASRIVKFRELLGGFHRKEQLLEVYNFPEETYLNIKEYLEIDSLLINQIRINFADYTELLRHPYLNKKQVSKIIEFRDENGPIQSLNHLLENSIINNSELEKVKPYLTCR